MNLGTLPLIKSHMCNPEFKMNFESLTQRQYHLNVELEFLLIWRVMEKGGIRPRISEDD